jgi:hypothetical protein
MSDMWRTLNNLKYQIRMTKGEAWRPENAPWGVMMEMFVEHLEALNHWLTHEHEFEQAFDDQGNYDAWRCTICGVPAYPTA